MSEPQPGGTRRAPLEAEPKDPVAQPASESARPPKKPLTPEEQMALYEENLKETDWGHQPC